MSNQLGCGLIRIGRPWAAHSTVPTDAEADIFLRYAYELGIRFFDTAPDYNLSESRLGRFLSSLSPNELAQCTIASKFGVHWDDGKSTVDHSFDVTRRSLDNSFSILPKIDVIQVHKATVAALSARSVQDALAFCRDQGITQFGASVSDAEAFRLAMELGVYDFIQCPVNAANTQFIPLAREATSRGITVLVNRPLDMGRSVQDASEVAHELHKAFAFINDAVDNAIVLSGTANPAHLRDNLLAFEASR